MNEKPPASTIPGSTDDDCPLSIGLQTRNMVCLAGVWCLIYLTAPVSYVGVTHANLLHDLGNSDTLANLPHAVYQWMTALPVLVAWFLPQARWLKPLLVGSFAAKAVLTALVAVAIWLRWPAVVVTATVILFAGVFGVANGVMLMTLWEVVRRGVSTARRGVTLALSFGIGPVAACAGSLMQQVLLSREPLTGYSFELSFPDSYLALFAGALPFMVLCVFLGAAFHIPPAVDEPIGSSRTAEILGGLRQFVTSRPIALAAVGYLLVYSGGNAIFDNVSLHAKDVLGDASPNTVGLQNFLRFGFKAVAGVLLGWLLAKTNPKATLLATTAILLAGMAKPTSRCGRTGKWRMVHWCSTARGPVCVRRRTTPTSRCTSIGRSSPRATAGSTCAALPRCRSGTSRWAPAACTTTRITPASPSRTPTIR